ncbi:MAG: AAA family ATPase, partial [Candidatus Ranarchaeia archaeon]
MVYIQKIELKGFKSFEKSFKIRFLNGFNAIVGPNGSGKCLSYDSSVTLADGTTVSIGELVEAQLKTGNAYKYADGYISGGDGTQILSLDLGTRQIVPRPILAFVKRKAPQTLLEIVLASGKRVVTTRYHPLFCLDANRKIKPLKADKLKPGVSIATATAEAINRATQNFHSARSLVEAPKSLFHGVPSLSDSCTSFPVTVDNSLCGPHSTASSKYCNPPNKMFFSFFSNNEPEMSQDIAWDFIAEVNVVRSNSKWVYDLCVGVDHNFITEGIVVHNSNIVDAIDFVLGQLSAHSMRSESMKDLIYTPEKKGEGQPAEFAKVTIYLN